MPVSLPLLDDLSQWLSNLASQTGRFKTFYMLETIKQHIDELKNLYCTWQNNDCLTLWIQLVSATQWLPLAQGVFESTRVL